MLLLLIKKLESSWWNSKNKIQSSGLCLRVGEGGKGINWMISVGLNDIDFKTVVGELKSTTDQKCRSPWNIRTICTFILLWLQSYLLDQDLSFSHQSYSIQETLKFALHANFYSCCGAAKDISWAARLKVTRFMALLWSTVQEDFTKESRLEVTLKGIPPWIKRPFVSADLCSKKNKG